MGRTLCIANQKGGVGKTTTAVNLAVAMARAGQRTLLVDLDPQCNATSGIGVEPTARHPLVVGAPPSEAIVATSTAGLDILPGSRSFKDVAALTGGQPEHAARLRAQLSHSAASYDAVLIDCPPSAGALTQTALASSDEVLMPIQCEFFAMEGLTQMIELIAQVIQRDAGQLKFGGIVLTMYDHLLELTAEIDREVRDFFGELVYRTVVPRDVAVAEAPSHGLSVIEYSPRSRGSLAYVELCMEVLERD